MMATSSDPEKAACVPSRLTPPDVPTSTILPFVINRGGVRLSTPSSVAHVSALAAAREAAKAAHHAG